MTIVSESTSQLFTDDTVRLDRSILLLRVASKTTLPTIAVLSSDVTL